MNVVQCNISWFLYVDDFAASAKFESTAGYSRGNRSVPKIFAKFICSSLGVPQNFDEGSSKDSQLPVNGQIRLLCCHSCATAHSDLSIGSINRKL